MLYGLGTCNLNKQQKEKAKDLIWFYSEDENVLTPTRSEYSSGMLSPLQSLSVASTINRRPTKLSLDLSALRTQRTYNV